MSLPRGAKVMNWWYYTMYPYYGPISLFFFFYFRGQQERSPSSPPVASGRQGSGAAVTGTKQKFREWTRITSRLSQGFSHYRFYLWSCEHSCSCWVFLPFFFVSDGASFSGFFYWFIFAPQGAGGAEFRGLLVSQLDLYNCYVLCRLTSCTLDFVMWLRSIPLQRSRHRGMLIS